MDLESQESQSSNLEVLPELHLDSRGTVPVKTWPYQKSVTTKACVWSSVLGLGAQPPLARSPCLSPPPEVLNSVAHATTSGFTYYYYYIIVSLKNTNNKKHPQQPSLTL